MSDNDEITLRGTSFTVSASEKVSTGDYENYNPHATIEGELPAAESELDQETRAAVKQELLKLHGDLQDILNKATGNRIAASDHEDWSFEDKEPQVKQAETVDAATNGGQTDGE